VARTDFTVVFRDHFGYVWGTLRRLGVPARDLEDQAQQVFMAVHAHLEEYRDEYPLRPWLFGFAYRSASNYRRLARHRIERFGVVVEAVSGTQSAADQLIAREDLDTAELALQRLDLDRRAVLLLHEVDGNSVPEIARALEIPLNTAYSRLRLAREDFQLAYRRISRQRGGNESA